MGWDSAVVKSMGLGIRGNGIEVPAQEHAGGVTLGATRNLSEPSSVHGSPRVVGVMVGQCPLKVPSTVPGAELTQHRML